MKIEKLVSNLARPANALRDLVSKVNELVDGVNNAGTGGGGSAPSGAGNLIIRLENGVTPEYPINDESIFNLLFENAVRWQDVIDAINSGVCVYYEVIDAMGPGTLFRIPYCYTRVDDEITGQLFGSIFSEGMSMGIYHQYDDAGDHIYFCVIPVSA